MIEFAKSSRHLTHPADSTTELYLVRHGQTEANRHHLFAGRTDVPLDEIGEQQIERVASRFRDIQLDAIVSSPLQRAFQTASAIGRVTGHEPILLNDLREVSFGDAEMLSIHQIIERWPEIVPLLSDVHDMTLRWPGGESRREFADRVIRVMDNILHEYADQTVAVVCHGGVITSLMAHLEDGPHSDFVRYSVANCSIMHVAITPEETIIHAWNDATHLDGLVMGPLRFDPVNEDEEEGSR